MAALSAKNGTYNASAQPATLSIDAVAYPGVGIVYTGPMGEHAEPTNAGSYKASVTIGGATSEVGYTIAKASQRAPTTVNYSVSGGKLTASTTPATGASGVNPPNGVCTGYGAIPLVPAPIV